jgi:hypothetical protein
MKKLNIGRILTWTGLLSLFLVYGILWARMIVDPTKRTGSDFIGIYTFGRIAQTESFHNIYHFDAQERVQEEMLGFQTYPQFYAHVPYIAFPAALVTEADFVVSFNRWSVLLLLFNALNTTLLIRTVRASQFTREQLFILFTGTFLFFPTFSGLMNGQDDALLLLGATIWMLGLFSGNQLLAGLGLSLTTIRPQIALFLAIPFLFRDRKVFWGFTLGAASLALFSVALIGFDGMSDFIYSLRVLEGTIWVQPHALDMPSLSGVIRRNIEITDIEPVRVFLWGIYAVGIITFSIIWHSSKEITHKHLGLLALFSLLLVPYSHYHDLTLLLIPIYCLIYILDRKKILEPGFLVTIPLLVSFITLIGFAGSGWIKFPAVYMAMALLGIALIAPEKFPFFKQADRHPNGQPSELST